MVSSLMLIVVERRETFHYYYPMGVHPPGDLTVTVLRQKLSQEERRTRSHRLIVRGAVFESIVPEAKTMTDEEAAALLRLALTSQPAQEFLRKRAEETTS